LNSLASNLINKINVKIVNVNNSKFLLDANSGKIFECNDDLYKIFNLRKYEFDNDIDKIKDLIEQKIISLEIDKNYFRGITLDKELFLDSKYVRNLWLSVSHICNLNCIYCYADGGSNNREKKLMTKELAKNCIDFWYKYLNKDLKSINVNFFGGEPLLNKEVVKFSINYINKLFKDSEVKILFILTTNGTIVDDDVLNLFKMDIVDILISMDGGKTTQNNNRPFLSGEGSYLKLKNNIKKIRNVNSKLCARMTLTYENINNFYNDVKDLWNLGFSKVFFDIAETKNSEEILDKIDLDNFKKQLKSIAENSYENFINNRNGQLLNLIKFARRIHSGTIKNQCSYYNPYTLMFSPDGEIYKCNRRLGNKTHSIGDINEGINWDKYVLLSSSQKINEYCKKCWIKRFCGGGCAANNFEITKDDNKVDKLSCEIKKIIFEQSMIFYLKLFKENNLLFRETFKNY
jgi:uncharacterized protein